MANIKLNNNEYSIPDSTLTTPRADFVAHLATIEGDGIRVVVDGIEYNVDPSKVADAVTEIEALLESLNTEITYADFTVTSSNRKKVGYTGAEGENLVIPETFQDTDGTWYKVTSLATNAFHSASGLASVTIPNSVTSMGNAVFKKCTGLISVTLSNSLACIEKYTFEGCTNLANIIIPNSVTTIETHAFRYCEALTSLIIPDSVTMINSSAFEEAGLVSIALPNSITCINRCLFIDCANLTSVTIPKSVTSIIEYAFYWCDALTDVYYEGTEEEWAAITIGTNNTPLTNATIHYNYQG